ncbi:MAG: hypothetical protein P8J27_15860 [Mariniblastus sp.]|nr:hypothetical protein [Mariniblastus sp.]
MIDFAIFVFAVIGFIKSLLWLLTLKDSSAANSNKSKEPKPSLAEDLKASQRLFQHLYATGKIDDQNYERLQKLIDSQFSAPRGSATRPETKLAPTEPNASRGNQISHKSPLETLTPSPDSTPALPNTPFDSGPSESTNDPPAEAVFVVDAELVGDLPQSAQAATRVAPWDLPDPPSPLPRKTLSELMSGFMQEKNMRWGELTSGILIVLSAVGLVISLREELSDKIPYFSAILFMLMTAAIHVAGIYTLKKWKLRNTSRGTLIIGLLLVPLNFVAACVLSHGDQQRAVDDPLLWTAVGVGLTAFATMTWWSSKALLRRGYWPLVVAMMGSGIGTLLINRLAGTGTSNLVYLLLGMPVLGSFLVGTCFFNRQQWVRQRWSKRAADRMFLFLGVSSFALIVSLSMVVIKAEAIARGAVLLSPIYSIVFIVVSWLGSVIFRGADGKSKQRLRVVGLTLKIAGLLMLGICLFSSIVNPAIFVANAMFSTIALMVMFIQQKEERLIPVAWCVFAGGVLVLLNAATGAFGFDEWVSRFQLAEALLNGKSGLCLLLTGVCVGLLNSSLKRFVIPDRQKRLLLSGWITGFGILSLGCFTTLIASLTNRDNVFDVMTASCLLCLVAIVLSAVCVALVRRGKYAKYSGLPSLAAVVLLGSLYHAILWNPSINAWVESVAGNTDVAWVLWFAIASLILVGLSVYSKYGALTRDVQSFTAESDSGDTQKSAMNFFDQFAGWGALATVALSFGLLLLVKHQTGWASLFQMVACLCWLGLGWGWHRRDEKLQLMTSLDFRKFSSVAFVLSTGLLVSVVTAELVLRMDWCASLASSRHGLIQLVVLSAWVVGCTVLRVCWEENQALKWVAESSVFAEKAVLWGLLTGICGLVCDATLCGTMSELFSESVMVSQFSIQAEPFWAFAALGAIAVAIVMSLFVAPMASLGVALVLVWMATFAFGAVFFEGSKSVASALRWLLPIGGLVGAGLVTTRRRMFPVWAAARNRLSLSGASRWRAGSTEQLINFALGIVVAVVLLISTVNVSQLLLSGSGSLGGPLPEAWFKRMPADVSFGVPVGMVVMTFLIYAISERCNRWATLGSVVFQYVVALAVVMLLLSPHQQLATSWFVNLLQVVSLSMTCYGFLWYWMRERIDSKALQGEGSGGYLGKLVKPIDAHALINGLSVTSLATVLMIRFYLEPEKPSGWIGAVGSPIGLVAWALFCGLAFCLWRGKRRRASVATWTWLIGWVGVVSTILIAAVVDRNISADLISNGLPRLPFKLLAVGGSMVVMVQTGVIALLRQRGVEWCSNASNPWLSERRLKRFKDVPFFHSIPVLGVGAVSLLFAVRGALIDSTGIWLYIAICAAVLVSTVGLGWLLRSAGVGLVTAGLTLLIVALVVLKDPQSWFTKMQPDLLNLAMASLGVLAIAWTGFYLYRRKKHFEPIPRSFLWMPNGVMLVGSIWILVAAIYQLVCDQSLLGSSLNNPLGMVAFMVLAILSAVSVFNDRARFQMISRCLMSLALAVVIASQVASDRQWKSSAIVMASGGVVALWGFLWLKRMALIGLAKKMGATRLIAAKRAAGRQLPILSLALCGLIIPWLLLNAFVFELGPQRYLSALTPFVLAIGFGCQATSSARRWLQLMTLGLITLGSLLVSWADLNPQTIFGESLIRLEVRGLIVMAGAMLIYGGLIARWVREGDTWLKSLRQAAIANCVLALSFTVLVLATEYWMFQPGVGCELSIPEATTVCILMIGMIMSLLAIAIRPENDPFALSLAGRMGYVYAAEFGCAGLVAHMYFSMPFLFESGFVDYWPFMMMAVCFAGVCIGQVLEKRHLTVLGRPLFETATVLPLLVAAAMFFVDSEADSALVLLTIGMTYLLISLTKGSILSGVGAVVFGNLALWAFFQRSPGFTFLEHPQLWLIPPALSTLLATHLSRKNLAPKQLLTIRYVCVTVIYMSSTIEVFISGVGQNLWPPLVLAILSVAGIMSGIMLQTRSFLYFGSLFLLMAMITMVAHAHQRLDHVWPWWAFGVGLGIAILVMFGLFEKRKKEMKEIAFRLKDWEG